MSAETDLQSAMSAGVAVSEHLRTTGGTATPNLLDLMGTFQTLVGPLASQFGMSMLAGMQSVRSGYANAVDAGVNWFNAALLQYAAVRGFPDKNPSIILRRLYQDFIDRSIRIKSRGFTFGTASAGGSNVGTGTLYRLTTDENGLAIENTTPQTVTARCIRDRNSGAAKHEEKFEIIGTDQQIDNIEIVGSVAKPTVIKALSGADSQSYFQNPSWDLMSGSGTTKFDNWTIGSAAANFDQNANYYRDYQGVATSYSLKQTADDTIAQSFALNSTQFDPGTPFFVRVMVNKTIGSGTNGTVTLTFGDQTATIAVSALAADWNALLLGLSSKAWYKNFMGTAPTLSVGVSGLTSGYLLYDDLIVAPFQPFDGLWYAPVGGGEGTFATRYDFQVNDLFTLTASATEAKIQRFLWQYYGLYLPHATGTPITWADPS